MRDREFEGRDDLGWLTGREGVPVALAERDEDDWDFSDDAPRPDLEDGLYIGDDVRTRRVHARHAGRAREFASADRDAYDRADYDPDRFGGPDA